MRNAAAFLRENDRFVILTHVRPDGDAAGSAAALCLGLRSLGKQAWVFENPQFTPRLSDFLEGLCRADVSPDDTVICVDTSSASILCKGAEGYADRIRLVIDHHISHNLPADLHLVNSDAAACGEIVYALLRELGVRITPQMADALYIAISTDTGCFRYSNTTSNTFRVAAELVGFGADSTRIGKVFFDTKSLSRLKLEARLTDSLELYADGTVSVCTIPKAWIDELHITEDDMDSISGFARAVEGVRIGIMIRELEDGSKVSLRTDSSCNAAEICQKLGGGGHAAAAGASIKGSTDTLKRKLLDALRESGIQI